MATVGYQQRVCETCGGTLAYDRAAKEFVCEYCGNRYERTERYDGQFSVRHAALQALHAITRRNTTLAEENINDCQKIDPAYPGSLIARFSYALYQAALKSAEGDQDASKNYIHQALEFYGKLPKPFSEAECDAEADFYENIESADVKALLLNYFSMVHDGERFAYVDERFDPSQVHGDTTSAIAREIDEGDWESVDKLLDSQGTFEPNAMIGRILTRYPASERKVENVHAILRRGLDRERARDVVSSYLASTDDALDVVAAIVTAFANESMSPRGSAVGGFLQSLADGDGAAVVTALGSASYSDEDLSAIGQALLCNARAGVITHTIEVLKNGDNYLSYNVSDLTYALSRADLSQEEKIALIDVVGRNGLTPKKRQALFGEMLMAAVPVGDKQAILGALAAESHAINPTMVDRYLNHATVDGPGKAEIMTTLIALTPARESLAYAAKRYAANPSDPPEIASPVLGTLASANLIR